VLDKGRLFVSKPILAEYRQVLGRPKFAKALSVERRDQILGMIEVTAEYAEPAEGVTDCRDAKDNKYLELALAAEADIIVSSDSDLLILNPWRGIDILRPAQFLERP
jgi:uncharacterized protein